MSTSAPNTPAPSTRPPRPRRAMRRALTALSGAILLAAAGTAALAGQWWPAQQVPVDPAVVPVAATATTQVCPGPPRVATAAAGADLGDDEFDPEGSGTVSVLDAVSLGREGQDPGAALLLPALDAESGEELPLTGDVRAGRLSDVGQATVFVTEPSDGQVALATGTSTALTDSGDLRGLVATPCQAPSSSAWLVGGSTEPGSSAQLVLSNVGDTAAGVTLRGWGSTGPVDMAAAGTVLVPSGGQQVVLLEAVAAAEPRLAVQVEASGGEVTALLQDSRLRGLVPIGTDVVVPGAPPADELAIPGIFLGESSGQGEDAPVVRIVNPGQQPVTAGLELLGTEDPQPVPGADELIIDPGAVVDVSLADLPGGTWTAAVTADGPVLGGAMVTVVGDAAPDDAAPDEPGTPPVDRTWVPASAGLTSGVVAVPEIGERVTSASLVLANTAQEAADVELVPVLAGGGRGEPLTRSLPAGTSLQEDVAGLAPSPVVALEVRAGDGAMVHGSLMLTAGGGLLSALPLTEDARAARAVTFAPAPSTLG